MDATTQSKAAVLVVDDEQSIRDVIARRLESEGYKCLTAANGEEALGMVSSQDFDIVLSDIKMPGLSGIDVLSRIVTDQPDTCVIMITGVSDTSTAVEAMKLGAYDYITKPFDLRALGLRVEKAFERRRLLLENRDYKLRLAKEALRESEQKYSVLVEQASDAVFVVQDGVMRFVNKGMSRTCGYAAGELIGRPFLSIVATVCLDEATERQLSDCVDERPTDFHEVKIVCKDGTTRDLEVSLSAIQYGGAPASMGVARDITERKKIEQMKSDFVSLVSHQLQTPIAEINGYVENMLGGLVGDLAPALKEYLLDIREICSTSRRLVSDLLNVSRIERGVLSADIQPVRLREIVDAVVKRYEKTIDAKGLTLDFDDRAEDILVLADNDKMVEALSNVVDNAVKFTDAGSISIRIGEEEAHALVEVSDSGPGMADDVLETLFSKHKVLSGRPRPGSGAGLGLFIAKHFMRLQNGNVTASSRPGRGSTFVFEIPKKGDPT